MEAAGLGLSALALFMECLKSYKVFSAARYLSFDLKLLKTQFQIEETRLSQWGLHWGYRHEPSECRLATAIEDAGESIALTIHSTLRQISALLKEYDMTVEKYDSTSNGFGPSYRGMVWALKDKTKLESIARNLNGFNDALYQLMPKRDAVSLAEAVACALTRDNNGNELDDIIIAVTGLQYADATKLAKFKAYYQMLEVKEDQPAASPAPPSILQLEESEFRFSSRYSSESRTYASLGGSRKVIVEWKLYHPSMLNGSGTARLTLRHRVSHFAELMSNRSPRPEGFNTLTCIGYFDQVPRERFGFAYDFPPNVVDSMPYTLHAHFKNSMPALGARFKMALSLARTLNLLHASGWLHKSISSNNIVIFQAKTTNFPEFENPYLLGFGFSRPDGYGEETFHEQSATESSNQLYRHPEVQGQSPRRYQASDDVYSLGLVLLEIALWMPLPAIEGRKSTTDYSPLNMESIMKRVASLPPRVGKIYRGVVQRCLNTSKTTPLSQAHQSAAEWNAELLRERNLFYWDVVKKLEECRA